jgi:MoaA/NifB/PqqE/SkfB family radical SAM enzyme
MKNCWLPFYHAEIHPNGAVRPCCKYESSWVDSIEQYPFKNRLEFEVEQLSFACRQCNVNEESYSYRKHRMIDFRKRSWKEPTEPVLKSLNLALDNICSSSCLQCDPLHSTTIGNLLNNPKKYEWDLDKLDPYLDTIEYVTISGGEPLQSPRLIDICKKLKKSPIKSISIPTGLANIKTRNVDALLELGIPIHCRVSIDAPWPLNNWIRGCDKNDWLENFYTVKELFTIAWQITLGSYNVYALPECLDYIETLSSNKHIQPSPVFNPQSHAVRQLPTDLKEIIYKKLISYTPTANSMEIVKTAADLLQVESSLSWEHCIEQIEKIPQLRKDNRTLNSFIKHYL